MSSKFRVPVLVFLLGIGLGMLLSSLSQAGRQPESSESPDSNEKTLAPAVVPEESIHAAASESLKWSQLQSTNLSEYVSHLRRIKCPEDLVEVIVRTELEFSYLPKVLALNHPTKFIGDPSGRLRARTMEMSNIGKEIGGILYDRLGIDWPVKESALFSAEEERRILEANRTYPSPPMFRNDPGDVSLSQSNNLRRIEYLSQYLPPEDLIYYKLDRQGEAVRIASLLRGLQPTKQEFLAVYTATEGKNLRIQDGHYDPDVAMALRAALGQTRFNQLMRLRKPDAERILKFAEWHRLSAQAQQQLLELELDAPNRPAETYLNAVTNILHWPGVIATYFKEVKQTN